MSHAIDLPIIKPFEIPSLGWTFTDNRDFDDAGSAAHLAAWTFQMARHFEPRGVDIGAFLCGHDHVRDMTTGWIEATQTSPDLTFGDYLAQDNRKVHTDLDGSRPQYFLGISNAGGDAIGGITITNIDVLASDAEHVEVGGIMALGVPYEGNCGPTLTIIAAHLINTPLPMINGLSMNFVEYECTVLNPPDPEMDEYISMMLNTVDVIGTIDDAAPGPQHVVFRRR